MKEEALDLTKGVVLEETLDLSYDRLLMMMMILHGADAFLRSKQSGNSLHCMDPEGSLPHSQEFATLSYPELIQAFATFCDCFCACDCLPCAV